jgi:ankyrin repeat protein/glycerol-3-phosphate responsive antiterminator
MLDSKAATDSPDNNDSPSVVGQFSSVSSSSSSSSSASVNSSDTTFQSSDLITLFENFSFQKKGELKSDEEKILMDQVRQLKVELEQKEAEREKKEEKGQEVQKDELEFSILLELAKVYSQLRNYFRMIESLSKISPEAPQYKDAQFVLGKWYHESGNYDYAEDHFQRALALDFSNKEAQVYLDSIKRAKADLVKKSVNIEDAWLSYKEKSLASIQSVAKETDDQEIQKNLQSLSFPWENFGVGEVLELVKDDPWAAMASLNIGDFEGLAQDFLRSRKSENLFKSYSGQVNGKNSWGQTPLHVCVGSLGLIKRLVEVYKANINEPDINGDTPIMLAVAVGKFDVAKYLLSHNPDLRIKNSKGNNIFLNLMEVSPLTNNLKVTDFIFVVVNYLRRQDLSPLRDRLLNELDIIVKKLVELHIERAELNAEIDNYADKARKYIEDNTQAKEATEARAKELLARHESLLAVKSVLDTEKEFNKVSNDRNLSSVYQLIALKSKKMEDEYSATLEKMQSLIFNPEDPKIISLKAKNQSLNLKIKEALSKIREQLKTLNTLNEISDVPLPLENTLFNDEAKLSLSDAQLQELYTVERDKLTLDGKREFGTNLLLRLVTERNRNGQTARSQAMQKGRIDVVELLDRVAQVVLEERIFGMFKRTFPWDAKNKKVRYAPDLDPLGTEDAFPHYLVFLRNYLPLLPHGVFVQQINCPLFIQVDPSLQLSYATFLKQIADLNEYLKRGLSAKNPEVNTIQVQASKQTAALYDVINAYGIANFDPQLTFFASSSLQPPRSLQLHRAVFAAMDQTIISFLPIIPQRILDEHIHLFQEYYQSFVREQIRELLENKKADPDNSDKNAEVPQTFLSGFWKVLGYGTKQPLSEGDKDIPAQSTALQKDFCDFLESRSIPVYQRFAESSTSDCEQFIREIRTELKTAYQAKLKVSEMPISTIVADILGFYKVVSISDSEKRYDAVRGFMIEALRKTGVEIESANLEGSIRGFISTCSEVISEGKKKIPIAAILKVFDKTTYQMLADEYLTNNPSGVLEIPDKCNPDELKKLFEKTLKPAANKLSKDSNYREFWALEDLFALVDVATSNSCKLLQKIWVLATGIPILPKPGWAKELSEKLAIKTNDTEFAAAYSLSRSENHVRSSTSQDQGLPERQK